MDAPALILRFTIVDPIPKKDSASQCQVGCGHFASTKVTRQLIQSHEGGSALLAGAGAWDHPGGGQVFGPSGSKRIVLDAVLKKFDRVELCGTLNRSNPVT